MNSVRGDEPFQVFAEYEARNTQEQRVLPGSTTAAACFRYAKGKCREDKRRAGSLPKAHYQKKRYPLRNKNIRRAKPIRRTRVLADQENQRPSNHSTAETPRRRGRFKQDS